MTKFDVDSDGFKKLFEDSSLDRIHARLEQISEVLDVGLNNVCECLTELLTVIKDIDKEKT